MCQNKCLCLYLWYKRFKGGFEMYKMELSQELKDVLKDPFQQKDNFIIIKTGNVYKLIISNDADYGILHDNKYLEYDAPGMFELEKSISTQRALKLSSSKLFVFKKMPPKFLIYLLTLLESSINYSYILNGEYDQDRKSKTRERVLKEFLKKKIDYLNDDYLINYFPFALQLGKVKGVGFKHGLTIVTFYAGSQKHKFLMNESGTHPSNLKDGPKDFIKKFTRKNVVAFVENVRKLRALNYKRKDT